MSIVKKPFSKTRTFPKSISGFILSKKKIFSWPILPKKEKLKKWPFLDKNHGLTPLEKLQFFDFLDFLFLQHRKAFYRSGIS